MCILMERCGIERRGGRRRKKEGLSSTRWSSRSWKRGWKPFRKDFPRE